MKHPDWPNDADGDVLRRLAAHGFDFSRSWPVEFNVDFEPWPPSAEELQLLEAAYGELRMYAPEEDGAGYVQFVVTGPLTYAGLMSVQNHASDLVSRFGGVCESWGVLH